MMAVVVTDVIARAIEPDWRLTGTLDMIELSLDGTLFLSIVVAILAGKVIAVDLVDAIDRRRVLSVIGSFAMLLILAIMAYQTIRHALSVREWGETTFDLGLPKFWYWMPIWIGLGLCVAGLSMRLVVQVMGGQAADSQVDNQ